MSLHVFALTGGIGSGKSTVSRHYRARGLPVVDADQLAREVVASGQPALEDIRRDFGPELVSASGELDRTALADIVFSDPHQLARLEGLLHPRIQQLAAARFAALAERGEPLAAYEVPLLFEKGLDRFYSPVVLVSAPRDVQVARARGRDASSTQAVLARIAAQMPLEAKAAKADYVIDNSGELSQTLASADRVLEALCERFGVPIRDYPIVPTR
ncbi:MAG TPA: dephospho-CoA kinase [Polyangiaceae bacterium]|nr:dephospho-CoA kinase [Polyangiaceae bacterium]